MGFPSGVQAFTTKQDGIDYPQASHVNLLQTEVQAIENALITGPITLPVSTLASLSVTGNSTLGGGLQVTGGSTVGTLNVTGGSTFASRPVMGPPDAARVILDADLAIPNGSTTAIAWTGDVILTNSSMHSTGTNPSRLIPQTTGVYACAAVVHWNYGGSTDLSVTVEDSSGGIIGYVRNQGSSGRLAHSLFGLKRFDTLAASPWARAVVLVTGSTNSIDRTVSQFSMWKL